MAYAMALTLIMPKELPMAKPNYSFEKRQRELAKKKKKEEKRQQKLKAKEEATQDQHPTVTGD